MAENLPSICRLSECSNAVAATTPDGCAIIPIGVVYSALCDVARELGISSDRIGRLHFDESKLVYAVSVSPSQRQTSCSHNADALVCRVGEILKTDLKALVQTDGSVLMIVNGIANDDNIESDAAEEQLGAFEAMRMKVAGRSVNRHIPIW